MIILGLKCFSHDTGAAILTDRSGGLEIIAISEARLNRRKHSFTYPLMSIAYCLDALSLEGLDEVDLICIDRHMEQWPDATSQFGFDNAVRRHHPRYDDNHRWNYLVEQTIRWSGTRVRWVNHVDAHAATAFYLSPFDEAAVLIAEGGTGIYHGQGLGLETIDRIGYLGETYSKGQKLAERQDHFVNTSFFYDKVGALLGYDVFGAGQTMALAGYANTVERRDHIEVDTDRFDGFIINHDQTVFGMSGMEGFSGDDAELISEQWINLARQAQETLEADLAHLVRLAKERTNAPYLTLAGGAALNCINNRKILDSSVFDDLFVQPAASDEGIPLGCALYGYYASGGRCRHVMNHAYLGQPNNPARVQATVGRWRLAGRPATPAEIAARLADGKILGRIASGSEYGPRALGNRSILADPRPPGMKDRVNAEIKHRESFRPFAPSCIEGDMPDYFDGPAQSPFMLMAGEVSAGGQNRIPAVVHADGSSRVQTVSSDQNPAYAEIIAAFGQLTGEPVLLNTSFNDRNEPIVETYDDAISCFLRTGLDGLILEDFLIDRSGTTPQPNSEDELARIASETERRYTDLIERFCDPNAFVQLATRLNDAEDQHPDKESAT